MSPLSCLLPFPPIFRAIALSLYRLLQGPSCGICEDVSPDLNHRVRLCVWLSCEASIRCRN